MAEFTRGGSETIRGKATALMLVAGIAFSGCTREGYGSGIEACRDGDNTGITAEIGRGDENDPVTVLRFVREGGERVYLDASTRNGSFWTSDDFLDQLGEVACIVASNREGVVEEGTVFTPSGALARAYYIDQSPRIVQNSTTSTIPG